MANSIAEQGDDLLVHPGRTVAAYREATGIYVRARLGSQWVNADIAQLDEPSLTRWLRSRGGDNECAESTVRLLLGHRTSPAVATGDADA